MKLALCLLLSSAVMIGGCIGQISLPGVDSKYCSSDADCACGRHITTNECFFGNAAFVNVSARCPDFCEGVAGNLKIVCENNKCVQKVRR